MAEFSITSAGTTGWQRTRCAASCFTAGPNSKRPAYRIAKRGTYDAREPVSTRSPAVKPSKLAVAVGLVSAAALVTTGAADPERPVTRTLADGRLRRRTLGGRRSRRRRDGRPRRTRATGSCSGTPRPRSSRALGLAHELRRRPPTSGGQRLTEVGARRNPRRSGSSRSPATTRSRALERDTRPQALDARLRDQRQRRGRGPCGRLPRACPRGRDAGGLQHVAGLPAAGVGPDPARLPARDALDSRRSGA